MDQGVQVCPWTYAYTTLAAIHAVNMRDKFENFKPTSLTINAPLIVKDEVDKVFELYQFRNKTKNPMMGLRVYCYLGPACPGALEGPRTYAYMIGLIE